jgi:GTPase Era involved in 16S rRNA processing
MDALTEASHPRFAVVGHPNKGKSSIVASLAYDDTVQISDTPGTTTRVRSFPLRVDGKVLYELFDTPGFQRARRVLTWLTSQDVRADKRPDAVRAFLREHESDPIFVDEVELLRPIMDGAGILYVVDGSKPYGEEYEAEMEILRWTGQPSMALINTIGEGDYTQEWQRALEQYFKLVRRYDPIESDYDDHMALLETIAQLREEWIAPVKRSMELFEAYHHQRFRQTAHVIAELIHRSLSHVEQMSIAGDEASDTERDEILVHYQTALRAYETRAQHAVERIWNHTGIDKEQEQILFDGVDLFSEESASIFGLSRKEMVFAGAAGGAATGAGIDLLLAGQTLLLGGLIGGVVGGVGAWWGFDELSEIRVLGMSLGRHTLEMGPMTNRNFPWILLGRALYHAESIISRSHARRGTVILTMDETFRDRWLDESLQKSLEKYHKLFRSGKELSSEEMMEYEKKILEALLKL